MDNNIIASCNSLIDKDDLKQIHREAENKFLLLCVFITLALAVFVTVFVLGTHKYFMFFILIPFIIFVLILWFHYKYKNKIIRDNFTLGQYLTQCKFYENYVYIRSILPSVDIKDNFQYSQIKKIKIQDKYIYLTIQNYNSVFQFIIKKDSIEGDFNFIINTKLK